MLIPWHQMAIAETLPIGSLTLSMIMLIVEVRNEAVLSGLFDPFSGLKQTITAFSAAVGGTHGEVPLD